MNFGEVFARSWEIIWKHKALWIFGLLAGLATINHGDAVGTGSSVNNLPGNGLQMPAPDGLPGWILALIVLAILALIPVLVILSAFGQAGLARGAWLADSGEAELPFSRLWSESQPYFSRVLLLALLLLAAGLAVVGILALLTLLLSIPTLGLAAICLTPLWCLLVPAFLLATLLFKLAIIAIAGEDRGVTESIRRAWEVFRGNLAEMIAMAIILGIGTLLFNFLVGLPLFLVSAPLVAAVLSQTGGIVRGGLALSAVLFLLYLPVLLAARGLLQSYVDTAWMLTFRRLTGRAAGSAENTGAA